MLVDQRGADEPREGLFSKGCDGSQAEDERDLIPYGPGPSQDGAGNAVVQRLVQHPSTKERFPLCEIGRTDVCKHGFDIAVSHFTDEEVSHRPPCRAPSPGP